MVVTQDVEIDLKGEKFLSKISVVHIFAAFLLYQGFVRLMLRLFIFARCEYLNNDVYLPNI